MNRNVHTVNTVRSDDDDRITPTVDLANLAFISEQEADAAAPTSEVRAVVSLSMVPRLTVAVHQLRELPIDPRAAFLVSLIDGEKRCLHDIIAGVVIVRRL